MSEQQPEREPNLDPSTETGRRNEEATGSDEEPSIGDAVREEEAGGGDASGAGAGGDAASAGALDPDPASDEDIGGGGDVTA